MNFDIIEVVRQMQHKHVRSISIENGEDVAISMSDGKVVVSRGVPPEPEDEIKPTEIER